MAPLQTSSLSIAVLGVGGIGSVAAYHLARASHQVTVVARPDSPRWRQLQRDQAIVLRTGETAAVRIADHLDEQIPYDLIIVTALAHQVDVLLPSLRRSPATRIHFMFNTFDPERLRCAVGEARASFGMPFFMARLDSKDKLDAKMSAGRKTSHSDQRWVTLFNSVGIPSAFEPNMPLWLRCHVPLCIAMESIAFQAKQRGTGASWQEAQTVAQRLHEGFQIVQSLGFPVYPQAKKLLNSTPKFAIAGLLWTLSRNKPFRELLATGINECRALTADLAAAAETKAALRSGAPLTAQ